MYDQSDDPGAYSCSHFYPHADEHAMGWQRQAYPYGWNGSYGATRAPYVQDIGLDGFGELLRNRIARAGRKAIDGMTDLVESAIRTEDAEVSSPEPDTEASDEDATFKKEDDMQDDTTNKTKNEKAADLVLGGFVFAMLVIGCITTAKVGIGVARKILRIG